MSVRNRADILVQGKIIGFFILGGFGLFYTWQKSNVKSSPIQTFPITEGILPREFVVGGLKGVSPGKGAIVRWIGVCKTGPWICPVSTP
jgi:hypothetical protein